MKKAAIVGAAVYGIGSMITTFVCASLRGGESLIGLLLFFPWAAVLAPARLIYGVLGLDWRVGSYREIPEGVIVLAIVLDSFLGALLGVAVWKAWRFVMRLIERHKHT